MTLSPCFVFPDGTQTYDAQEVRNRLPEEDRPLFDASVARLPRWFNCQLVLLIRNRIPADAPAYKHPGWLEYGMEVIRYDNSKLYIGCIQRFIGADCEFHS